MRRRRMRRNKRMAKKQRKRKSLRWKIMLLKECQNDYYDKLLYIFLLKAKTV